MRRSAGCGVNRARLTLRKEAGHGRAVGVKGGRGVLQHREGVDHQQAGNEEVAQREPHRARALENQPHAIISRSEQPARVAQAASSQSTRAHMHRFHSLIRLALHPSFASSQSNPPSSPPSPLTAFADSSLTIAADLESYSAYVASLRATVSHFLVASGSLEPFVRSS